ncbi:GNAT family N-acetyltransferase [Devosia sp. XK-2]|uniref:GNAT family N-acetyltransferase n=1 Tax=Devosia sp. XK-2 TaxID=3126689 RepID=UPI0030D368EF
MLRAPALSDWPGYAALMRSKRAVFMGGPYGEREAWGMFTSDLAMWELFGHGALMIDLIDSRVCVGQVGINHGPLFPEKELGWLLYEGFEGHGYASEAGAALKAWAFEDLGLETLVSYFHPRNSKSMAVSARLGGVRDDMAAKQDPEDVVFRYPR